MTSHIDKKRYTNVKAPGKLLLRIIGIIYIVLGVFAIVLWVNGFIDIPWYPGFLAPLIGGFGVVKGNDLSKTGITLVLAIINFIACVVFVDFSFSLAMLLVLALPILFFIGAYKNYTDYKRLSEIQSETALWNISGKPSFVTDNIIMSVSIVMGISFLLRGQSVGFFLLLIFIVVPVGRLITSLNNSIVADDTGIFGKIKREPFRLAYHQISSVGIASETDRKNLLIVSGCQTYSIRISNAYAVRDTILHNMAILELTPAPMETPALAIMPEHTTTASDAVILHTSECPTAESSDPLRQQIVALYKREIAGVVGGIPTLHLFEEVPSRKLENAIKSYAPSLGSDERVIFLFDGTMTGSGKSGFILTTKNLYNKPTLAKATKSSIINIVRAIDMSEHKNDKYVITIELDTGNHIQVIMSVDTFQKAVVTRVLNKTIDLLKKQ